MTYFQKEHSKMFASNFRWNIHKDENELMTAIENDHLLSEGNVSIKLAIVTVIWHSHHQKTSRKIGDRSHNKIPPSKIINRRIKRVHQMNILSSSSKVELHLQSPTQTLSQVTNNADVLTNPSPSSILSFAPNSFKSNRALINMASTRLF